MGEAEHGGAGRGHQSESEPMQGEESIPVWCERSEPVEYKEGNLMSIRAQEGWGESPLRKADLHGVSEPVQV